MGSIFFRNKIYFFIFSLSMAVFSTRVEAQSQTCQVFINSSRGNWEAPLRLEPVPLADPILRTPCQPVEASDFGGEKLGQLVNKMAAAVKKWRGAGLAAPQVGVDRQIVVVALRATNIWTDFRRIFRSSIQVMINPQILEVSSEKVTAPEGCISFRQVLPDGSTLFPRMNVTRATSIRVRYWDAMGIEHIEDYDGFNARVIQHEVDHLRGVLIDDQPKY